MQSKPTGALILRVAAGAGLAAALLLTVPGCMTVRDRRFNAYSPGNGDPTVIERAQHVVDGAGEALDTFDAWQENYIY